MHLQAGPFKVNNDCASISTNKIGASQYFSTNGLIREKPVRKTFSPVADESKRVNASLMSCFCSSVSSNLELPERRLPELPTEPRLGAGGGGAALIAMEGVL